MLPGGLGLNPLVGSVILHTISLSPHPPGLARMFVQVDGMEKTKQTFWLMQYLHIFSLIITVQILFPANPGCITLPPSISDLPCFPGQ